MSKDVKHSLFAYAFIALVEAIKGTGLKYQSEFTVNNRKRVAPQGLYEMELTVDFCDEHRWFTTMPTGADQERIMWAFEGALRKIRDLYRSSSFTNVIAKGMRCICDDKYVDYPGRKFYRVVVHFSIEDEDWTSLEEFADRHPVHVYLDIRLLESFLRSELMR